jgi:hypothetical protein
MRSATLFDCFERHLLNLEIEAEAEELFIAKVLEDYILNLVAEGVSLGNMAEDVYGELQDEAIEMLNKTIYGHYSIDSYRAYLRCRPGRPDAA